ncbi:MAG: Abi family protein [Burkholderiales bacterium]|nr:Abi family protein [Burkholderiales bacterium]
MPTQKPTLVIENLTNHLNANNIETNANSTHSFLSFINYALLKPYIAITPKDPSTNKIDIQQIVKHYDFDRKLKLLLWDGLERIEVACRSMLSLTMYEETLNEQWMFDINNYTDHSEPYNVLVNYFGRENIKSYLNKNGITVIPEWKILMDICKDIIFSNFNASTYNSLKSHKFFDSTIDTLLHNNLISAHIDVQNYVNTGTTQLKDRNLILGYMFSKLNVPFYIIMNKLDFGKTNTIINNLKPQFREKIAKRFSISLKEIDIAKHIEHFRSIRNKIAHHEPLCNAKLKPIDNFANFSKFGNDNINNYKDLIVFYLDLIAPRNTLNDKINNLIEHYADKYKINFNSWGF